MGCSNTLFDSNFKPKDDLIEVLKLAGMEFPAEHQTSIEQINAWAQANLLRNGERWQEQAGKFEDLKDRIKPILSKLGLITASKPQHKDYQGAIIHGGRLQTVRARLKYLLDQWQQGVKFSELYFLCGERPLDDESENSVLMQRDENSPLAIKADWKAPKKFPETECEMIKLIWDQTEIPEQILSSVAVSFISAPMKKNPNSSQLIRPTTKDTIEEWLKSSPAIGTYLAVTNAPYTSRQDLEIKQLSPTNFSFDTIGYGANEQEKVAILLDELARLIFTITKNYKS